MRNVSTHSDAPARECECAGLPPKAPLMSGNPVPTCAPFHTTCPGRSAHGYPAGVRPETHEPREGIRSSPMQRHAESHNAADDHNKCASRRAPSRIECPPLGMMPSSGITIRRRCPDQAFVSAASSRSTALRLSLTRPWSSTRITLTLRTSPTLHTSVTDFT